MNGTGLTFRISGAPIEGTSRDQLMESLGGGGMDAELFSLQTHRSAGRAVDRDVQPGEDIVVLKLASGPALFLHPDSARALLIAGMPTTRDGKDSGDAAVVGVSSSLPWSEDGPTRSLGSWASGVALEWFGILRRKSGQSLAERGADWIRQQFDKPERQGLYRLTSSAPPDEMDPADRIPVLKLPAQPDAPILVLVHGTFSTTAGTFRHLWTKDSTANTLLNGYKDDAYGFEHPTLGTSPVQNAVDLAKALPPNARVHLLTHSRGGLVAEILVRAANSSNAVAQIEQYFIGAPPDESRQVLELVDLVRDKNLRFDRVIRVACPVRGTLLASERLDAYLSVLHWLMQMAQLPIASGVLAGLREIARAGLKPETFAGLASMHPRSHLVRWLNAPLEPVDSQLYVIAGNSGGNSLFTWIKTLLADSFFWTDNDLVVQTRSMYSGVPRKTGLRAARFMLGNGGEVSHFSYFSFTQTREAIADALLPTPQRPWEPIGLLSWAGADSSGVRGSEAPPQAAPAPGDRQRRRPTVIVVPDFLGSHLDERRGRLWLSQLSLSAFASLGLDKAKDLEKVSSTGLVEHCYGALCSRLAETHDVIPLPYDWRKPVEEAAANLATRVREWQQQRAGGPLRILAHGMGGLVVRAFHMNHKDLWEEAMAFEGARVLMLGVPHEGSWTPLQVLSGGDALAGLLSAGAPLFADLQVRKALATMPGFIQLQAGLLDPALQLDLRSGWEKQEELQREELAKLTQWHEGPSAWAIPAQQLLTDARLFWDRMRKDMATFEGEAEKIVIVAGKAKHTVDHAAMRDGRLWLSGNGRGDGRVSLDSARMNQLTVWKIDAEHGAMPAATRAFSGLLDLLNAGKTHLLDRQELQPTQQVRTATGSSALMDEPARLLQRLMTNARPPELGQLFSVAEAEQREHAVKAPLSVEVHHGDLRFLRQPLLIGHYQSLILSGSEAVVDKLVGQRMSKALRAGMYPEWVGSHQIFENGQRIEIRRQKQRLIPRPSAAVVVGLGEEGKLNSQKHAYTIRVGVLAYAERLGESGYNDDTFEIAATLLGSGGTGISVGDAALALVQGIMDANAKIADINQSGGARWPTVRALTIAEVYLDRASDAWRVLKLHDQTNPGRLVIGRSVTEAEGNLRRPVESSYRGATYDFISVLRTPSAKDAEPQIGYSLDTRRARTEVRAQRAQGPLIRDLMEKASNSTVVDPLIGRTLFNLLVPVEIEPYLAGSNDMVMELDRDTAALPWELLDTDPDRKMASGNGPQPPWAVRSKIIRKLQTEHFRDKVIDAGSEDNVLIVGEPLTDSSYPRLPGAKHEAEAVAKVARASLGTASDRVKELNSNDDAHTIINQLFARNYRLVHIAGHGMRGANGGVVLSGRRTFLGPNEIRAMRVTPELVFINCCHLGQGDVQPFDRPDFAASVAEELIRIGVRCVVAAGWMVEDQPAERFASAFYAAIFNGCRFIDAVGQARLAAWEAKRESNTWAAYQCYGDPDWSWRNEVSTRKPSPETEYANIASPSTLEVVLQTIATETLYASSDNAIRHRRHLSYLEQQFGQWTQRGAIAEAFGNAYAALPDRGKALEWFRKARNASDSKASLSAIERYAEQLSMPEASVDELNEATVVLTVMIERLGGTLRRYSLLGHAHKRLSMRLAEQGLDSKAESLAHLVSACENFTLASQAQDDEKRYSFYPPRAVLMCELRHYFQKQQARPSADWESRRISEATRAVDKAVQDDPNFFSIVAQSELDVLKALIRGDLRQIMHDIEHSLCDLHRRIDTKMFWIWVHDDARFLLEAYAALPRNRANPAEQAEVQAASKLLGMLASYAGEDAGRRDPEARAPTDAREERSEVSPVQTVA
ncbi:CHAT domain-containing protein [Massilia sp. ST3]|uniref:CHAT domain-containing protein n=1 Tax=Massilia sp. ST3 TaxID=2824903 RepID=UPI001B8332B2|nr:CHAT domain-containing protein [Massilia sp. ST3]MBQ5946539.1 CHAT domain-containing protein [Massilia sp. ST3]